MHSGEQQPRILESSAHSSNVGSAYDGKIAGLYDLEETLGSGHFAVVKLARHVFTGAKVAVKVVDKTKLDEVSKAHLFQEVRCMKLVQHPNVVRLYEVIDTQTKLYLVLELGDGGDLYDYIMKHDGGLSENLARKYFRQILRAITYCHELHVVHRDLKPENVVFFEKLGVVKLTDFGFSNKFSPGQKLETFCGSLAYSAPEILLGDSYDAPAVDIWSLGVILYMLVCGQPPFEKANDSETLTMIMDCKYTVPEQVTHNCRKLIASMLVRDPKKRATLDQIAADPWVKENVEGDTCDYLPLVSREELSEEDHAFVIQKMINGNIASKEDILHALDKDKYNHITATYYLLAEIRLRKRREEQFLKKGHQLLPAVSKKSTFVGVSRAQVPDKKSKPLENKQLVVPINIVCTPEPIISEMKTDKRNRKCSIVREEDEDESSFEHTTEGNELKVAVTRRESISDGRLNRSIQERSLSNTAPVVVSMEAETKMVTSIDAALAHKLNQIDKDTIEVMMSSTNATNATLKELEMQDTLKDLRELEIGKLKPLPTNTGKNQVLHRRHSKLNKIRTPSCSSSEASDDDTKARSKKKIHKFVGDTPSRFRMHRRDSHDDSSDSQDQTFPPSGSQAGHEATNLITANNSNISNKKDGQPPHNKSEETRNKSSHSTHGHTQKHKTKQSKDYFEKHAASDKQQSHSFVLNVRRRRIRESQSLDRITEAQEYEMRHRILVTDIHNEQRNSLFNLHTFPVVETKEEYDDEENNQSHTDKSDNLRNSMNVTKTTLHLKPHNSSNNIYKLNSIEEIDLILGEKSLSKAIQVAGSKCFVTMKKIRRLGKYFPVVNFS